MKLGATILVLVVGLCAVRGFNVAGPVKLSSRQAGPQRSRWLSMVEKAAPAAAAAKKRSMKVQFVQETPGGFITVVEVKNPKGMTQHRIVVGKDQVEHYSEIAGKEVAVKDLVMYVVKFMMDKGMSLDNTEGMIDSAVFPVNYFTLKQLTYYHEDVDEKLIQYCKDEPNLLGEL